MSSRRLQQTIPSVATSDGAGVSLRRSLGQSQASALDPFLMLDEFSSDNPDDYIAGFPSHPHRGFETVTYMLDGHMLHEDHLGNRGDLLPGGAQWMTAGRGIIHSEMPQQESGRMRGFQLWINLPAAEKMKPAHYRDIRPEEIPTVALSGGGEARVIAGSIAGDSGVVSGPVQGLSTDPLYIDVRLPAAAASPGSCRPGTAPLSMPMKEALPSVPPPSAATSKLRLPACYRSVKDMSRSPPLPDLPVSCCWPRDRCMNPWCSTDLSS
jgi:redox-sensitive bicupin YhaK (pirin superfamily)